MKLRLRFRHAELNDIATFYFTPETDPMPQWEAGQYARFALETPEGYIDHWFTISSAPHENIVAVTTRLRDTPFKNSLARMRPEDTISAVAFGGDFTWVDQEKRMVFIAAGLGITPYRAMVAERRHSLASVPAHLLYGTRGSEFIFADFFDETAEKYQDFRVDYLPQSDLASADFISLVPEINNSVIYVAGADQTVTEICDKLLMMGVQSHDIKRDIYTGYSDGSDD